MSRACRWLLPAFALATCAMILPSCATDGHVTLLGYTTKTNYDTSIRTVRVPIFKNRTMWTVAPVVGMEQDLTRAVVREIELKTPYKVVQDCENADTELRGVIVSFAKVMLNYNPYNEVREAETQLIVQLIWRDLRTGKILSRGPRRPGGGADGEPRQPLLATPDSIFPPGVKVPPVASTPLAPNVVLGPDDDPLNEAQNPFLDPVTKQPIPPAIVSSTGHFRPELGESLTTAMQENYDRMAVQIVSLMEVGW
jgi:hypothetical protein